MTHDTALEYAQAINNAQPNQTGPIGARWISTVRFIGPRGIPNSKVYCVTVEFTQNAQVSFYTEDTAKAFLNTLLCK